MGKSLPSLEQAVSSITDGAILMISGFGGSGSPSNLTVINNNAGNCKIGLAVMIYAGMVKKK